jgi:hypothetical protein
MTDPKNLRAAIDYAAKTLAPRHGVFAVEVDGRIAKIAPDTDGYLVRFELPRLVAVVGLDQTKMELASAERKLDPVVEEKIMHAAARLRGEQIRNWFEHATEHPIDFTTADDRSLEKVEWVATTMIEHGERLMRALAATKGRV